MTAVVEPLCVLANAQLNASLAPVDLVMLFSHLRTSVVEMAIAAAEFDFHC